MAREDDDKSLPPLLPESALAVRWHLSRRTLQRWRSSGAGPPFIMLGGRVRYREADILAYEDAHYGEACHG